MKHTWLGAALAALLLSGCSIYGNESARVVDRNVAYGQSGNFGGQGGLQPQQPQQGGFNFNGGYANAGQAVPPPVNPAYANNQPLRPQMGQPPVNTPTVPNVPPPVQQTQVQAANPYQPAAPNIAKTPAPAPGWGAPADQPKVTPAPNANQPAAPGAAAIRDAVKEAPKVAVADPAAAANNKRQALRPNTSTEPAANPAAPPPVETKTVASNTPAPAAPAKEEGETAVSALLKKASGSLGKGDLDGAAAYLENAQRLDPKNSKILYDIANIRYHQGRYKEAESMASRAVQTGGSNAMLKKSWSLISNSRNKLGDSQGAVQAATKAASY